MSEARELNHSYVGTEHLLLGLLREKAGIAARVLGGNGVTLEQARAETLRLLTTEMPSGPTPRLTQGTRPPRMSQQLHHAPLGDGELRTEGPHGPSVAKPLLKPAIGGGKPEPGLAPARPYLNT